MEHDPFVGVLAFGMTVQAGSACALHTRSHCMAPFFSLFFSYPLSHTHAHTIHIYKYVCLAHTLFLSHTHSHYISLAHTHTHAFSLSLTHCLSVARDAPWQYMRSFVLCNQVVVLLGTMKHHRCLAGKRSANEEPSFLLRYYSQA